MTPGSFAFGLERLGQACARRPWLSLGVLAVISVVAVYGLLQLRFDDDLRRLFRSGGERDAVYERLIKAFPAVEDELLLLIESPRPLNRDQLEALRELHLDLRFVDGVEGVTSIFSLRRPPDGTGAAPTLLPTDLPDGAALDQRLEAIHKHALFGSMLLTGKHDATLFILAASPGVRGRAAGPLIDAVRALATAAERRAGVSITATGPLAIRHDILSALYADLKLLNTLGAILAIFICVLFLRRAKLVIIAALPPIIAVLWTLGGFGLLGHPLTAINNVLPPLILVIAFCDALHMTQFIRRRLSEGATTALAVEDALREVGPACAMTSITTMIACLSLVISQSDSIREFALAGAVSVATAYLAVITLVPTLALVLLPARIAGPLADDPFNIALARMSRWFADAQARWRAPIAALAPVVLVVSGVFYFLVPTSYDYRQYLSPSTPSNQAIDRINERFGGADVFYVLITARTGTAPEAMLRAAREVHETLARRSDVNGVFSLVTAHDWFTAGAGGKLEIDKLIARLPVHLAKRLVSADGRSWLISAYMPAAPAPLTRARLKDMESALAPIRADNAGVKLAITGTTALAAYSSDTMISGLKTSLAGAVLVTVVIIAISVRSWRLALLSALPNLLPLSLVAAGLYFTGSGFDISGVLALTIAFGIAVDNTIHMLNRYRLERHDKDAAAAMRETVLRLAPVLIAATLLLGAGLAVTQISELPARAVFGRMSITVLIVALFAAMLVLPALVVSVARMSRGDIKRGIRVS